VREFLEHSQSQLTFSGLFQLVSELETDTLVALFRNSHLSVLIKRQEAEGPALYSLVTDQVFLRETSVVWERLEDIDGGWSTFVDSDFVRSSPAGGDFAGQTAEDALRAMESMNLSDQVDTSDPQECVVLSFAITRDSDDGLAELWQRSSKQKRSTWLGESTRNTKGKNMSVARRHSNKRKTAVKINRS
jgi:ubiquitin carboxyl-terminal hydrolase MINDY-1/2